MNIGVIGPPSRISGSTKIAFGQSIALAQRRHKVYLVLQKCGLDPVKKLYKGLFNGINLVELDPIPIISTLSDKLTLSYRRISAGVNAPITQDMWYDRHAKEQLKLVGNAQASDIDFASFFLRAPAVSGLLIQQGCKALICYATLMAAPVLPLFFSSKVRKVLYFLDMPISKTLVTEGKSPNSSLVKTIVKYERWVLNHSDAIAVSSNRHYEDWSQWYDCKPKIIPPGCTPSPRMPTTKSKYVLTVTYWNPDKRPLFFLDLAEQLKGSDLKLVMAGHWPNPENLEEMKRRIKQRRLSKKIMVIPECTEEALKRLYQNACCFVAPPKSGGYMMGALEAASYGTPIIYPKIAGAWDVFTPGVHGLVANIEDIGHVAACIRKFENDGLVCQMGHEIWLRAKELSWEAHASAIEALLSK